MTPQASQTATQTGTVPRFRFVTLLALILAFTLPAHAADPIKIAFDLPADTATKSLKRFSEQSGREVLFGSTVTQGVRTQPVKGELTPREALDAMLTNTPLIVVQDD